MIDKPRTVADGACAEEVLRPPMASIGKYGLHARESVSVETRCTRAR